MMDQTFDALDRLTDDVEMQTSRDLLRAYQTSLKEIRSQIAFNYEKYSNNGILDFAQMQKYNRLAALESNIVQEIKKLYSATGKTLTRNLTQTYVTNYLYTGYILEGAAQMKLGFSMLPDKAIEAAIQNPISGLTLSQRLEKHRNDIIIRTREQLTQGLIQGESIDKMGRRIKDIYDGDARKSLTIAQTETARCRNEGKEKGYEKAQAMGVKFRKVWMATLDSRTRHNHQKLDGEYADDEGYFHVGRFKSKHPGGFGVAEMDINCRCTTRAELPGFAPEKRKDNVSKEIIDYKGYNEWLNGKSIDKKVTLTPKSDILKDTFKNIQPDKRAKILNSFAIYDDEYKGIVAKYSDKLTEIKDITKTSHFMPHQNYIAMNISKDGAEWERTFRHEFGHLIDCNAINNMPISYKDDGFRNSLINDSVAFTGESQASKYKAKELNNLLISPEFEEEAGLSDIFCCISNTNVSGYYGHSTKYLQGIGKKEAECFANMFDIYASKKQNVIDLLERELPETVAAFKKLLETIGGK